MFQEEAKKVTTESQTKKENRIAVSSESHSYEIFPTPLQQG